MAQKRLTIDYQEYASMAEMEEADRSLLERAVKATEGSYAPYSKYNVGAAVLLSDGTVVTGANQENAAFPSGLCAERTALFAAHAQYPKSRPGPAEPAVRSSPSPRKEPRPPSVSSWEASAVLSYFPVWRIFFRLSSTDYREERS